MAQEGLLLEVVTPDREVVHEQVAEVQLPGSTGYLGVLPGHTPLLTELAIGALSYKKGSEKRYVAVMGGFAEVLPDRVTVLADAADRAEEIDPAQAREAFAAAQTMMAKSPQDSETDWDALQKSYTAANVRLEVYGHAAGVITGSQSSRTH